jgi:dihydroxyacetone kinase-like predicted kinase
VNTAAVIADSLDGLRLNRALKAGIARLLSRQEHLNKINVFPVPDGDTGTNLALTMSAVLGALQRWPDSHAGKTLTRIADAALDGARGNSGAILAQFFLGLCDRLGHLRDLTPEDFADGVHGGAA